MNIPKLTYNAAAHYAGEEQYPNGLASAIIEPGKPGFEALCWALSELSTQTELIRRDLGYDKRPILSPEYFARTLKLPDVVAAKGDVIKAISRGLNAGEEDDEVDEVLLELQKKTEATE